jgi:putative transposase
MPRTERFAPAGVPLHVTQRGNFRAPVFRGEGDYQLYLELLRMYSKEYGIRVVGYCLMPNHVHLVVIPARERGVSQMIRVLAGTSSRLLNERLKRVGHVWQARFYSATLSDLHYRTALACVDLNPVRAGLVKEAVDYRWSSAGAHMGVVADRGLLDWGEFSQMYSEKEWGEILRVEENKALVEELRYATRVGRIAGGPEFVKRLEVQYGRTLTPKRPGRPLVVKAGA